MLKAKLILWAAKILIIGITAGLGIWYLSASIGGGAITYTSLDNFMTAIGASDGNVANVNGCFLCKYIAELFTIIGNATELFWNMLVNHLWYIMIIGFSIFILVHTVQYMLDKSKAAMEMSDQEQKFEIKEWAEKIWKQGFRIMVVGALLGMLGAGGTNALKGVAQVTITPVMFVGAEFAMAATGVVNAAQCDALNSISDYQSEQSDILNPILNPFMCVIGNINTVILAGAAGGFALMNYAWMDMGGGAITWIAGLLLVLMFLAVGFDLFFQILSVVFKLIFLIIFLPLFLAATAFEKVWSKAGGLLSNGIGMLISSAVQIVSITLKVLVVYATVSYSADAFFPGPTDGYSAILPPLMGNAAVNPDAQTLSVMNVFATCEQVALKNGEMDKEEFKKCFDKERIDVEKKYPGAFDFVDNGWEFLLMMACLFLLYFYIISPKIDKMLYTKDNKMFEYGAWVKSLGQQVWGYPMQLAKKVADAAGKK